MTQNPVLSGAATGVILGNSNIEAFQVSDDLIAASVIERLARAGGHRINVRQYGWSGISVPVYVAIAAKILAAIHPAWVAVVLNDSDLGAAGLTESRYWRARLDRTGQMRVFEVSDSERLSTKAGITSSAVRIARNLMQRSTLAFLLVKKVQEIVESGEIPAWETDTAMASGQAFTQASVAALKRAYGACLLIVYVPQIHIKPEAAHVPKETDLLAACAGQGVRCVSMREVTVRARDTDHPMLTGFNNTEPGVGHLNAFGHEALAKVIWRTLRASS